MTWNGSGVVLKRLSIYNDFSETKVVNDDILA